MGGTGPGSGITVDTVGLFCPMPIIKLAEAMKRADPGTVITVISDDPGIVPDLPAWCVGHGHELLELREEPEGKYLGRVRKRAG